MVPSDHAFPYETVCGAFCCLGRVWLSVPRLSVGWHWAITGMPLSVLPGLLTFSKLGPFLWLVINLGVFSHRVSGKREAVFCPRVKTLAVFGIFTLFDNKLLNCTFKYYLCYYLFEILTLSLLVLSSSVVTGFTALSGLVSWASAVFALQWWQFAQPYPAFYPSAGGSNSGPQAKPHTNWAISPVSGHFSRSEHTVSI